MSASRPAAWETASEKIEDGCLRQGIRARSVPVHYGLLFSLSRRQNHIILKARRENPEQQWPPVLNFICMKIRRPIIQQREGKICVSFSLLEEFIVLRSLHELCLNTSREINSDIVRFVMPQIVSDGLLLFIACGAHCPVTSI